MRTSEITAAQAERELSERGFIPIENYPLSLSRPWKVRCVVCGEERAIPLERIITRGGKACPHKAMVRTALLRGASLHPLAPYPGTDQKPWHVACDFCEEGHQLPVSKVCQWKGCPCDKQELGEQASAVMLRSGYRPIKPFPGILAPWDCLCLKCGSIITPSYTDAKSCAKGAACETCTNPPAKKTAPSTAEAIMRAAGYIPLEPYPGGKANWLCKCAKCGAEATPRFTNVRQSGSKAGCVFCDREERRKRRVQTGKAFREAQLASPMLGLADFVRDRNLAIKPGEALLNVGYLRKSLQEPGVPPDPHL